MKIEGIECKKKIFTIHTPSEKSNQEYAKKKPPKKPQKTYKEIREIQAICYNNFEKKIQEVLLKRVYPIANEHKKEWLT